MDRSTHQDGPHRYHSVCQTLGTGNPSLVGALLFTFVITWNELLMALILTSKNTTLPVVAAGFTTLGMEVPRGLINASAILLALPPLLLIGLVLRFIDGFLEKKSS
jgi:multiple sugar transport system permease protein